MSTKIVSINPEAAKQRNLIESFKAAAAVLDQLDLGIVLDMDEAARYQHVEQLSMAIADKIDCDSTHKEAFKAAATNILIMKIIPNIQSANSWDGDMGHLDKIKQGQKPVMVAALVSDAVRLKLLPSSLEHRVPA